MSLRPVLTAVHFQERRRAARARPMLSRVPSRRLPPSTTVLCFSHLRWDFVYQRPQHLLSRLARHNTVHYVEEAVPTDGPAWLERRSVDANLSVLVPHLPAQECAVADAAGESSLRRLLDAFLSEQGIVHPLCWYYTPMALGYTGHLQPSQVVYDCMDELSAFHGAPPQMLAREHALLERADVVFTGGHSLYDAKRAAHPHVHAFPSSVDVQHFAQARRRGTEPEDMAALPHPRIGFYGVIDERLDIGLLSAVAAARPDWHWVLLGPVVKIDPASLPTGPNLHYLGGRPYEQLPAYLGAWDVAMMPFALNAATRFISPTKTPEYLAGGVPVVSTPIVDVVRGYGDSGLVHIADNPEAFIVAVQAALDQRAGDRPTLNCHADTLLRGLSWDRTIDDMLRLIAERLHARHRAPVAAVPTRATLLVANEQGARTARPVSG